METNQKGKRMARIFGKLRWITKEEFIKSSQIFLSVTQFFYSPYQVPSRSQSLFKPFLDRLTPFVESTTMAPLKSPSSPALVKIASPEVVKYGSRPVDLTLLSSQCPCWCNKSTHALSDRPEVSKQPALASQTPSQVFPPSSSIRY